MLKLGLGLIVIATAPIAVFQSRDGRTVSLIFAFLILVVTMRMMKFCGVFSSLRHFMLPRKRAWQGEIVEEDSDAAATDSNAAKKLCTAATAAGTSESTVSNRKSCSINRSSCSGTKEEEGHALVMARRDSNPADIDEDLHSRQLAVYGRDTMRRLFASNVLVSGMQGLGAEIGTNFEDLIDLIIILIKRTNFLVSWWLWFLRLCVGIRY